MSKRNTHNTHRPNKHPSNDYKHESSKNTNPQIKNRAGTTPTPASSHINAKPNNLSSYINKPLMKYGLIAIASFYLLKYTGEIVANRHADNQFKKRWEQTQDISTENTYNLEKTLDILTVYEKFETLDLFKSMESKVENETNIESLIKHINTNQDEIIKLTSTEYETNGFVLLDEKGIHISPISSLTQEISQYITELKSNNFTNKDFFVNILLTNPNLVFQTEPSPNEKKIISFMFDILEAQNSNSFSLNFENTPHKNNKSPQILAATNERGEIIKQYTPEEISTITKHATSLLDSLQIRLQYISIWQPNNFLGKKNALSRYHTHPKNDINYMPSDGDKSNTLFFGPNVLFSQTNDTLRAYLIHKNKSTKIYEQRINIKSK
ncbi:MAG: hypothetical protein ACP5N2_06690 [Candidatus Nanoarchaeia archaeon]